MTMLSETLLRISFSLLVRCSQAPTSHWLEEKCARSTKKKNLKTIRACTKSSYLLLYISLQKIFISWHNPFNLPHPYPAPLKKGNTEGIECKIKYAKRPMHDSYKKNQVFPLLMFEKKKIPQIFIFSAFFMCSSNLFLFTIIFTKEFGLSYTIVFIKIIRHKLRFLI